MAERRVYRSVNDPGVWEDVEFLMSVAGGQCSNAEIVRRTGVGLYALEKKVGARREFDDRREFVSP